MRTLTLSACCLLVLAVPAAARAQNAEADEQIRTAIRRGVQYLKMHQQADGSWNYGGHQVGITALAGLALAENGVTVDDPALKRAYEYVQANAPSNVQTYDISLAILFLVRVGKASDNDLIKGLGARLAAGQLASGGWTYNCPSSVPVPPAASVTNKPSAKTDTTKPGAKADAPKRAGRINIAPPLRAGFGDNSNTQFAVLGIWAAGRIGLDVKDTMAEVDRRFRGTQAGTGGWGYNGPGADTSAMTCAGLMALILAKGEKTLEAQMVARRGGADQPEGPGGRPKMDSDKQIDKGIERVEFYAARLGPGANHYLLWSIERVGVALGTARIGRVDWYSAGATFLIKSQNADGSWRSSYGDLADTSFALLFLRRSNLAKGMPQLVTNRGGTESETKMRAGSLEDLIKTVKPPAGAPPKTEPDSSDKPK